MPALPKDRLLSAFSVLSSTTLFAIVFSVMTNKAIALLAGPEGIALMGLFRTLGAFISGTITMGFATIVVQRVSTARDRSQIDSILGAASLLFLIQAAMVAFVALVAAEPLGRWLLGSSFTGVTPAEVRIVLAMALINLLLGLVTAALNGQSDIRPITAVYLATAVSSFLLIFPLLSLGRKGLAINVGSGGIVGACLGLYYLRRIFRFSLDGAWGRKWTTLRASVSTSAWLIAQNLSVLGGLLAIQRVVGRSHGLEALGGFSAAMLIIDTAVMAIMSSARTYALPALGRANDESQKRALLSRVLALRVVAATAVSAALIFGARPVLSILFSNRFGSSADVMTILGFSLVASSFSWSYNSFLLHRSDMRSYVLIDMTWIASMYLSVWTCGALGLSVNAMAWAYTGSCVLSAALYAAFCWRRYGFSLLTGENIRLGGGCVAWLLSAYISAQQSSLLWLLAFLCASAAAAWALGLVQRLTGWLELDRSVPV